MNRALSISASRSTAAWWLGLALIGAAALVAPPLAEPRIFRELADERVLFGIAAFWNVASNVPLFLVGAWGLYAVSRGDARMFVDPAEKAPWYVCFAAVALAGVGSTYYHLAPDTDRLMWDRLPIAMCFMALVASVISERVSVEEGRRALLPLVVAGAASAAYWRWSELRGVENILPYGLVQYGAFCVVVALAALLPPKYTRSTDLYIGAALYAAAKFVEVLDAQIYGLGEVLSGHTLKHLLAAIAVWWLVRMLKLRRPVSPPSSGHPTR